MARNVLACSVLLFAISFIGCSDEPPPCPTCPDERVVPPPPPVPTPASISVEVVGAGALASGNGNLLFLELLLKEAAGTGANINFIRVDIFRATGEFEERAEIGADEIEQATGSNRLEGSSSRQDVWALFFRATVKRGRTLEVTLGFTDDVGNDVEKRLRFVFTG